jgi:predicted DNA-binding protein
MSYSTQINVRLKPEEMKVIEKTMKKSGKNKSEVVREFIEEGVKVVVRRKRRKN